jgi:hypothetical protein
LRTGEGLALDDTLDEFALLRDTEHADCTDGWEMYRGAGRLGCSCFSHWFASSPLNR